MRGVSRSIRQNAPPEFPAPWEWLYALVGSGMWVFTTSRFRVEVVGNPLPRVGEGQLWISTHRAETDVPLLAGVLFVQGGMWRGARSRMHFAARDDLFRPGVVAAGIRLPGPLARFVWPLSPGAWLSHVRAHPIRRPTGLKLEQVVADLPGDTPLDGILGPRVIALLDRAAARHGGPAPRSVNDLRNARYARELWEDVGEDDLVEGRGRAIWRAHIARAAGDVRRIVGMVRDGRPTLLFPEGRVSPDGSISPLSDVLDLVVRRGRPRVIVPIGIAYDPLTRRRTEVAVGVGAPIEPGGEPMQAVASEALRHATPVTCGQVVARFVTDAGPLDRTPTTVGDVGRLLDEAVRAAMGDRRPVVRSLISPSRRPERLREALDALVRRGCISLLRDGVIRPDPARIRADVAVQRLATEDRDLRRLP